MTITAVWIDLAKGVFIMHGIGEHGKAQEPGRLNPAARVRRA